MKLFVKAALLLVVLFAVWTTATYPLIGEIVFQKGAQLEAHLYGLQKSAVDIGELEMVTYQGGPAGAETIVMVHGYTADKDVWPRFARHLVDDYQVVIPDLAGHGETAFKPDWDYSIAAQSQRIAKLMDALNINKAHIIGNSMGGHIAAYFAIHYPQRTLSTAPVDPAGVVSPEASDMEKMLAQGNNPFLFDTRDGFRQFYPMTMEKAPWLPGFVLDAVADKYIALQAQNTAIFTAISSTSVQNDLARLKAPTLLIWGDHDRLLHVSATQVWSAAVPQMQVVIMPGIGHMPMVEAPAETAAIYRNFLDNITP